jgi:hypothetical protein
VQDTVYRRARRGLVSNLHALDDRLSRRQATSARILFEAASPMSFVILRPLYQRLVSDNRLELWFTAKGEVWRPRDLYQTFGITDNVISPGKAAWTKVDAFVNTDFWDMTWVHRRTRRIHLFHGVAGKYNLDTPLDLAPTIAAFDCLMFINADRRDRYVNAGLVTPDSAHASLVGYPKVDCLVDGSLDRQAIARALGLSPGVPTVIYAPTWSPYASLNTVGEELIDRLAAEGLQVLVKLHDRSYDRRQRGAGGIDWAARLARYESHPQVRVVREPDGCPFLAVADAMVSDHSSIAFEYMLLDRPVVVIDCPELIRHAAISTDKVERLRASAAVADGAATAAAAVVRSLREPDRLSAVRQRTAADLFYRPGTATDRAVTLLYELIGLPAPADTACTLQTQHAPLVGQSSWHSPSPYQF